MGPALPPKLKSNYEWIYLSFLPPFSFLRCCVKVAVVYGAQGYSELIADLKS
jgi:hypothetical protein